MTRLHSLTDDQISHTPWLKSLRDFSPSDMSIVLPNDQPQPLTRDFLPLFKLPDRISTADPQIPFAWHPPPLPLRYLHITHVSLTSPTLSGFLDFFVVERRRNQGIIPLTEHFRLDIANPSLPIVLPLKIDPTKNVRLVTLHYQRDPTLSLLVDDWRAFVPQAICFTAVEASQASVEVTVPLQAAAVSAGLSVVDYMAGALLSGKRALGSLSLSVADSPAGARRLTATDAMFASPLVTIANIAVEFGDAAEQPFCSLRVAACAGGRAEAVRAYVRPDGAALAAGGDTASVQPAVRGDRRVAHFADALHFVLDPLMVDDVAFHFTLFAADGGRLTEVGAFAQAVADLRFDNAVALKPPRNVRVTFNCLLPVAYAPPLELRRSLEDASLLPEASHQMYPDVLPYLAQTHLTQESLSAAGFAKIVYLFAKPPESLQIWIEHYFVPPDRAFLEVFVRCLVSQIRTVDPAAMELFLLIFKTMVINETFDAALLDQLFAAVARLRREKTPVGPKCLQSACRIILQFAFIRQVKFAQSIACKFVSQLEAVDRCTAFRIFFSDPAFFQLLFRSKSQAPLTPYVPLVSLFYSTVYSILRPPDTFNGSDSIQFAKHQEFFQLFDAFVLTIERYAERKVYRILFPLFTIFLEYYVFCPPETQIKLIPFAWSIMRNCVPSMQYFYYSIFDNGTRGYVFDFLAILWDKASIAFFVKVAGLKQPDFLNEVCNRTITFLSFLETRAPNAEFEIIGIIRLVCQLLEYSLSRRSTKRLLQWLTPFVELNKKSIFEKRSMFLFQLLVSVCEVAIRGNENHEEALSFIQQFINLERQVRPKITRSRIVIQYAVCRACLTTENCTPFWLKLPTEFARIHNLSHDFQKARTTGLLQIRELARLYSISRGFPSIKASIGGHIVKVNEERDDFLAAFMTQWNLTALIADVLRLRGEVDLELPEGKDFPFVGDAVRVDVSKHSPDSVFLVLESDLLTVSAMRRAARHSLELSQRLRIRQIHCSVCSFLLQHLGLAVEVKENSHASWLEDVDNKELGFVRISLKGELAEQNKLKDVILAFDRRASAMIDMVRSFAIELFKQGEFSLKESYETLGGQGTRNQCTYCAVKCGRDDLEAFAAKQFWLDVKCQEVRKWGDAIVHRYVFEIEQALPSIVSFIPVTKSEKVAISREQYYRAKLERFERKLNRAYRNIKAVIPPPFLCESWSALLQDISPKPLVRLLQKIGVAQPGGLAPYALVLNAFSRCEAGDVPDAITEVVGRICRRIGKSVNLCDRLGEIRRLLPEDQEIIERFRFGPSERRASRI